MSRKCAFIFLFIFSLIFSACSDDGDTQLKKRSATTRKFDPDQIPFPPGKPFEEPKLADYPQKDLPKGMYLVTRKYGLLVVKSGREEFQASHQPWSSWWFPVIEKDLVERAKEQPLSPLEKYDLVARQLGQRNSGAQKGQENLINNNIVTIGEGYSLARSFAAAIHPEPFRSAYILGVCFTPSDLKALLMMTYTNTQPENWSGLWGHRNRGATRIKDIYPEELIRLLQVELKEKKQVILLDLNHGEQENISVIYKARIIIQRSSKNTEVIGTLILFNPKHDLTLSERQKDQLLPLGTIQESSSYYFKLFGKWDNKGEFTVQRGIWRGQSENNHPDFAISLPNLVEMQNYRDSENSEINPIIVDKIIEQLSTAPACP